MLRKLATTLGIVLLGSSFAFAAQSYPSTQPATPRAAQAQRQNAPVKKHHAKKHHKRSKKQGRTTTTARSR